VQSDRGGRDLNDAAAALGLDVASVEEVEGSYSSTVRVLRLRSGGEAVLKIPFTAVKMRRERAALGALAHLPFVPRVLGSFETADGRAALLLSRLPGAPLRSHEECSPALAAAVGRALAQIHTARLGHVAGLPCDGSWVEVLRGRFAEYAPLGRAAFPGAPWDRVAAAFEAGLAALPLSPQPVLLHSDFRCANILRAGDAVSGVVDFESSRDGEPQIDFLKLAMELWDVAPHLREPTLGGYGEVRPVPPRLDELRPFHELVSSVACVAWSARRGQTATPFCRENLERMQRAVHTLDRR
jgi:aminoglycoside phosphotransferase (APT) family kinase protein